MKKENWEKEFDKLTSAIKFKENLKGKNIVTNEDIEIVNPDFLAKRFRRILRHYFKPFIKELLNSEKSKDRQKFIDALIWCSGSEDFQIGGKARKGWEKICKPLIKKSLTPEEWFKRKPPLK